MHKKPNLLRRLTIGEENNQHNLAKLEKAFNQETVPVLSYGKYISKIGQHIWKDIPVPATYFATQRLRKWWLRWCGKKHERNLVDDPEIAEVISAGSISSSEESFHIDENLWPNNGLSIMAYLALIFNVNNIIRFPDACYQHGGSIFLVTYALLVVLMIQPLIYLEMMVGQFSQAGISGLSRFDIYSDGFTSVLSIMCLMFVPYNEIVLGYNGAYIFGAFFDQSNNCGKWNELKSCVPYSTFKDSDEGKNHVLQPIFFENATIRTSLLSTELYFRQVILNQPWHGTPGTDFGNPIHLNTFLGLIITYVLVFFAIQNNLTDRAAQILVCSSALLPTSLLVILIIQFQWEGASDGIYYFLEVRWENFQSLEFWAEAFRHAITSSGIGYGFYECLSSRNPPTFVSFYSTSWIICGCNFLICTLSSLVIYSEVGIIHHIFGAGSFVNIFAEKTGISFVSYSGALLKIGEIWPPVVFFSIMSLCGIWQQSVATEMCAEMLIWFVSSKRKKSLQILRRCLLMGVILLQFFWATSLIHMWPYIMDADNLFGGTWAASLMTLAEVYVTIYIYGFNLLIIDIEIIMQYSVPNLFRMQIKYVAPAVMVMAVGMLTIEIIINPVTFYLKRIRSPNWLSVIGFLLNVIPVIALVLVGISAYQRRKEALENKKVGTKEPEGKPRRFELAYRRLTRRRGDVFAQNTVQDETTMMETLEREEECLMRRQKVQNDIKDRLRKSMNQKRAKVLWQRIVNKVLIAEGRVNTITNLVMFVIRECDRIKNIKEAKYLNHVLRKFSLESVFISAQMEDHGNPKEEYKEFLQGALACASASVLAENYQPLTPYELLIGKRIPKADEERLAMIVRIKQHMEIPSRLEEVKLRRLIRQEEQRSHQDSCFFEEAPHEYYVETSEKIIVRIIAVKGTDHSLLRTLPFPRPPEIRLPIYSIDGGSVHATMKNIQIHVENDIIWNRKHRTAMNQRQFRPGKINKTTAYDNNKTFLNRPTKFPNWHYGAAVYPYRISAEGTYVVVLMDSNDYAVRNKFRWLQKRKTRKVWPNYKVELEGKPKSQFPEKQGRKTYPISLLELFKYKKLVKERDAMINAPADIIYHRDEGSSDDSLQISLTSSSTSSSSSNFEGIDIEFSEMIEESAFIIPEIFILDDEDNDDFNQQLVSRRTSRMSTATSADAETHLDAESQTYRSEPPLYPISRKPSLKIPGSPRKSTTGVKFHKDLTHVAHTQAATVGKRRSSQKRSSVTVTKFLSNNKGNRSSLPMQTVGLGKTPSGTSAGSVGSTESRKNRLKPPSHHHKLGKKTSSKRLIKQSSSIRIGNKQSKGKVGWRNNDDINRPKSNMKFRSLEKEDYGFNAETLSLKAVWSQNSARAIHEVHPTGAAASRRLTIVPARKLRKAMTMRHWNDSEKFAYRSEGRTLCVEHKEDAERVFVWAKPGDSIASIEGETKKLIPEDAENQPEKQSKTFIS